MFNEPFHVIPAKAGSQFFKCIFWIHASAGMRGHDDKRKILKLLADNSGLKSLFKLCNIEIQKIRDYLSLMEKTLHAEKILLIFSCPLITFTTSYAARSNRFKEIQIKRRGKTMLIKQQKNSLHQQKIVIFRTYSIWFYLALSLLQVQ